MKYTENELIGMNQKEFCAKLLNKQVVMTNKNGSELKGYITEIGLAANVSIDTQDHLPVSIKINSKINIFNIRLIELP